MGGHYVVMATLATPVAALILLFPYVVTDWNEQIDAIGSTRDPSSVEAADWNVGLTWIGAAFLYLVGGLILSLESPWGPHLAASAILVGAVLRYRWRTVDWRDYDGRRDPRFDAFTGLTFLVTGAVFGALQFL